MRRPPPQRPLFPYTTLFRSEEVGKTFQTHIIFNHHPAGSILFDTQFINQWRSNDSGGPDDVWRPDCLIIDRKSTRLNSSHVAISYAVFCLKKKRNEQMEVKR